jgi:thiamine-monophosphate kinase
VDEFDLIARVRSILEAGAAADGPADVVIASGDDAAVTVPPGATATSVDSIVDGVHFRRETASLRSVGHKALAAALSDLAAMGAQPGEAYVQLGVPEDLTMPEADELTQGLSHCARAAGVRVLGGDVTRAPALWLGVTVVGHAERASAMVSRAGARVGEVVLVSGPLGGAGAGLLLLEDPGLADSLAPSVAEELRARQLEPSPRLAAGAALALAGATAMIDISDGIAADAAHIAAASGVALVVELERLPLAQGVAEVAVAAGRDPLELAATAGEDYELLATFPPEAVDAATRALEGTGTTPAVVGRVEDGSGFSLVAGDGTDRRDLHGFDQLHAPRSPDDRA